MKEVWFNHVKSNKSFWTHGMTLKKVNKVKDAVFFDKIIMRDLLLRHGTDKQSPKEMENYDKELYNHCIGNFVCNIHYKMMELGIIKG